MKKGFILVSISLTYHLILANELFGSQVRTCDKLLQEGHAQVLTIG